VVDREFTNDKAVDFRAILTTLKSKNVDLIFFGGLDEQGAMLVKQMRSLGMPAQLFGAGALKSNAFLRSQVQRRTVRRTWSPAQPLINCLPRSNLANVTRRGLTKTSNCTRRLRMTQHSR
jgi:ABC-type branched-subunit amino acid transport system substrate-binding protein